MNQSLVCDSASALGMRIEDEFVVVALGSGKLFHFTAESEAFFRSFQTPQSPEQFAQAHNLSETESREMESFCSFLVSEKVLSPCEPSAGEKPDAQGAYVRPKLVRQGDKTLSEFQFSYP
jgi:hypothetical protein